MLVAWVLLPLVLVALCAGCGLAVARLAGGRVEAPLVLPLGMAALVVVASAATASDATARLATPLVVALAVAGFVVAEDRRAWLPGRWPAAAAAGVFAVFAAPVVLSGSATFTGYIQLDDIATWLALTDQAMSHGRDLSGLAPSTREAALASYLPGGYPVGAFLPLGVGHALVGSDVAWLFAPTMAVMAGLLTLTLTSLAAGLVARPAARAAVAFVAAQSAMLFSYAEWGAIKELLAAGLIALMAALAPALLTGSPRRALAPAVAAAALLAALSAGAVAWVVPVLGVALLAARPRLAPLGRSLPALGAGIALLSVPSLVLAKTFLAPQVKEGSILSAPTELGNLPGPLGFEHVLGIWPAGDFRLTPDDEALTRLLLAALVVAAVCGLALALRRGAAPLVGYVVGSLVACLALIERGSPWVDAKAMATASPAVLLLGLSALAAAAAAPWLGRAAQGACVAGIGALAAAVLWSNALTYGTAYLAPKEQLSELQSAGTLLAGEGPTLMTEYEPYGARHFLRDADAESASELRRRVIPLRNGMQLPKSGAADVSAFDPAAPREYRSLVLRVDPLASRPPSAYRLLREGGAYDVWQRAATAPAAPVTDLPLGGDAAPGAVPDCTAVEALATEAGPGGRLVAVARRPPVVQDLAATDHPLAWITNPAAPRSVVPTGDGRLTTQVDVPEAGRYEVWLGGSTRGTTTVRIDGREVGAVRTRLNNQGGTMRFGTVTLRRGSHRVELDYRDGGLRPGTRGQRSTPLPLGPLVLARPEATPAPFSVPVAQARRLCDRYLDWVEAHPAGG